ncbi:alpha/beta fold hydrolase [Amycolatopsis anabasis]|uniref:alpha/beta fold hydrolase n=1 Tax=Amycolatopsis anabasis TaxID=1840409 RepID=UPI00131AA9F8|nr:alpha/beta fold hydrolase [Amycolatopsis anabasis]
MTTFVLVPGAFHGGWWYEPLVRELRKLGHTAHPLTLTGIGDRAHLISASVNLDTHIQDVVGLLETEDITDAVLCGHSAGGMVIAGAADRVPERIDAVVHVDAFVPGDGDSMWDLAGEYWQRQYLAGTGVNGYTFDPFPGLDPRTTPHPLAAALQRIRLTGAAARIRRRDFVYLAAFEETPFAGTFERLRNDPAWHVHSLPYGHNIIGEAPDELLRILLAAAQSNRKRSTEPEA